MTLQQISKLWTVVGAVLLYYTLNSWLASQGGNEIFGVKLVHSGRAAIALFGILIGAKLLIAASLVGLLFVWRLPPSTGAAALAWPGRIPLVGFESVDMRSPEGKLYQLAMLVLFSVVPCFALVHFWNVLSDSTVIVSVPGAASTIATGIWDRASYHGLGDVVRICDRLVEGIPEKKCDGGGVTFFPFVEPLVLALLSGFAALAVATHWISVFRRS